MQKQKRKGKKIQIAKIKTKKNVDSKYISYSLNARSVQNTDSHGTPQITFFFLSKSSHEFLVQIAKWFRVAVSAVLKSKLAFSSQGQNPQSTLLFNPQVEVEEEKKYSCAMFLITAARESFGGFFLIYFMNSSLGHQIHLTTTHDMSQTPRVNIASNFRFYRKKKKKFTSNIFQCKFTNWATLIGALTL